MTNSTAKDTASKKVLIADDAAIIRNRLSGQVKKLPGIGQVLESSNFFDTLRMIFAERPDVILLDFFMPGGTGLDVLHQLKEKHYSPLIIILTAWEDGNMREKCLAAGAAYYFSKNTEFLQAMDTIGIIAIEGDSHDDH